MLLKTETENQLWQSIKEFPLDIPTAKLTFSNRLARENNWTKAYTEAVIAEYRKFLFLCCITPKGSMITPSDAVDQAWHLHLTYTKSYWKELCEQTLQREIHHNPTQGGAEENNKFENCYEHTFALYREKFGIEPPENIWLDNKKRFAPDNFVRINTKNYLLIQKPLWLKDFVSFANFTKITSLSIFVITILAMCFVNAFDIGMILFAIQYVILFVAFIYWIRSRREIKKLKLLEAKKRIDLGKKQVSNPNLQKTVQKQPQKIENQNNEIVGDLGFIIADGISNHGIYNDNSNDNSFNSSDSDSSDSDSSSGCSSSCGGGCGGD